tara:strand:+ start:4201 stop:5076 length:876 start_codon:yes stop_codon:yes gene_type:complete
MRITTFLLLLSALVGCTRTQVHERTEEQVVKMPPASIRVELTSGSVSLTVTRALDATVRAIWSTSDGDRTAAEVRLMQCDLGIDTDSGTFEINPKMPENVSVSLVITLPDTQGVIINTGNGSIDVNGASGSAMLTSGNGAIRCVDQDGTVSARTDNGAIQVVNATDAVEVISRNGAIEILEAMAYVRAKTNSGRIVLTTQDDSSPPIFAQSDNGSVDVTVGPAFVGEIAMKAVNGTSTVEDPGQRLRVNAVDGDVRHLVLGDSEQRTSISTRNGSVRLTIGTGPPPGDPAG